MLLNRAHQSPFKVDDFILGGGVQATERSILPERQNTCTEAPLPPDTISMPGDGADTFFTTSVHLSVLLWPHLCSSEVLPGGIEAVVGAHGVMSEKLPSVSTIRSGICQTHQEAVSSHTQLPGTHTQPEPPLGAALHHHQLDLP